MYGNIKPRVAVCRASKSDQWAGSRNYASRALLLAAATGALSGVATHAFAQTDTWVGNTSANWADSNWSGTNNPPVSGDSLIFDVAGTSGLNLNNNLTSATFNVAGITFTANAGAYVLGNGTAGAGANRGNAFNLIGPVTNNGVNTQTINDAFNLSGSSTFTTTTGGGNLYLSGPISGTGAAVFAGTGNTTIGSNNSYTGGTTVNSGTVTLVTGGGSGTIRGVLNINTGASVVLSTADDLGYNSGACVSLVNINGGLINDAGNNNEGYITNFNLTGGTMNSSGTGAYNFNTNFGINSLSSSTTSTVNAPIVIRSGAFPLNVSPGTTSSGVDLNMTGNISGGGPLVLSGGGTLQLSGNETYTGGTSVASGALQVGAGQTLNYSGGNITIGTTAGNTANWNLTGGTFNSGSGITIYVANGGAGITNGNISLSNNAVFNAPNATLVLGQYGDTTNAGNISVATLNMSGGSVLNANHILLGGANNAAYTNGVINLNGGTINTAYIKLGATKLTSVSATQEVLNANGGTIQAAYGTTYTNYFNGIFVNLAAGGLNFNTAGNPVTITNAMSGVGGLTKLGTGTLTLSGSSSYTGATALNTGTLNLTGALTGTSSLTLSPGTTLITPGTAIGTATIGGLTNINGAGTLLMTNSSSAALTTGGLSLGDGNSFGTADSSVLLFNANAGTLEPITIASGSTPGLLNVNASGAYVSVSGLSAVGNYTLITFGSQTGPGTFSLSNTTAGVTTLSVGRQNYQLMDSANSLVLAVTGSSAPNVAYFNGAVSSNWSDVSNPSKVNFSTDLAGATDAGNIPGPATDVILDAQTKAGASVTTTLGSSLTINSLNVNSQSSSNTIAADGSTLTINGLADSNTASDSSYTGNAAGVGISMLAGSGPLTVNAAIALGGNGASQTWINASASNLSTGGTVSSTSGTQTLTLSATGTGNIILGGSETNGGGVLGLNVNSSGSGLVILSGSSTYTGATQVVAGTLQVASGGVFNASGAVTVGTTGSPATFSVAGGTVNESGTLTVGTATGGNSTVSISSGTLNYSGGNITIGNAAGSTSNFTMTGGTFNSGSGITIYVSNDGAGITNGNITLSNSAVFNTPAATLVLGQYGDTAASANVSTATLTMSGSSVLNVSSIVLGCNNASAYENGIINLNGGTIITSNIHKGSTAVATSATAIVLNANGGTLQATGASASFLPAIFVNLAAGGLNFNAGGFAVNIATPMSGVGGLTTVGTGVLSLSASNTYAGATNISSGTLSVGYGGTTGTIPLASQIIDSSVLAFNRSNTAVQGVDFPVISGSGSIAQNGLGVTQLSLNNSYTGKTAINAGVLEFTNPQALYGGNQASWTSANITIAPGAALGVLLGTGGFAPADAATFISGLSTNGALTANATIALDSGSSAVTYAPVIADTVAGPLRVEKIGTGSITLTGSNTYSGGTNIANGTLVYGSPQAFGAPGSTVIESGTGTIGITSDSQIADSSFNLSNYAVNYSSGVGIAFQNYNSSLSFANIANVRLGAATGTASTLLGNVSGANSLTYTGLGTLTLAGTVQSSQLLVRQGTLILSGPNASVQATIFSSVGFNPGDNGSLVLQNGAVFTSTSDLNISDTSGTTANTGTVTIADSTSGLNVANLYVGKGNAVETPANNIGILNQLAGTTTVSTTLVVGQYGVGTYNLSGGTLQMNGSSFTIGTEPGATGLLNISGAGVLNDATTGPIYLTNSGGAGTNASLTLSGNAVFNAPSSILVVGQFAASTATANASTATVTVSDNSILSAGSIKLGGRNLAFYVDPVLNLNGGTIITNSITQGATLFTPGPTAVVINANGGTIQATGTNASFFAGDYINLQTGGMNFNTAGFGVNTSTGMVGAGGFTKTGLGTLVFAQTGGANTYAGPTNVSGGVLEVIGDGVLPSGNNVIVGKGAVLIAGDQGVVSGSSTSPSSINMNGAMIIYGGDLGATTALAKAGYNNGNWNGTSGVPSIFSSAAAADPSHLTAVGVIVNDDGTGNPLYPSTFEGQSTIDGDILVKATYYGDTNLDGQVDSADYARIDAGYLSQSGSPLTGWQNGDFNYDGVINGSDYTLIDNAFNTQGAQILAQIASPTAQISGVSAVPEPASLGLLGIGAAGLLSRRRRSR